MTKITKPTNEYDFLGKERGRFRIAGCLVVQCDFCDFFEKDSK